MEEEQVKELFDPKIIYNNIFKIGLHQRQFIHISETLRSLLIKTSTLLKKLTKEQFFF